jgi:hypothetical protein
MRTTFFYYFFIHVLFKQACAIIGSVAHNMTT